MDGEARELELKFIVDPLDADAMTSALSAGETLGGRTLTSIYFDTPRRALWRAGFTLRVRKDGRRWTQTIKSRDGLDGGLARGEWEAPVRGGGPDLGAARRTPLAGALPRRAHLAPLFTVTVERTSWLVTEAAGVVEVSLDRGVAEGRSRSAPFFEVELELKSGHPEALFTLARRLRGTLPLRLSFTTKAERGVALIGKARETARHFQAPRLHRRMTAGEAFRAIARAALQQIAGNVEYLGAGRGEEAVHQMRVGARRLRADLATFKSVIADAQADAMETELKWLTGELDAVRNLDVFLCGAYHRIAPDNVGRSALGRRLRRARAAALARALAAVQSERFSRLLFDTLTWIESGPWILPEAPGAARRDAPIAILASRALEKGRRKVRARGRRLKDMDREARHRLRIKAKILRYGADSFAGLFGHPKRAGRFVDALKTLLASLGDLNDIATGERIAAELGAPEPLVAAEAARQDDLIDDARNAFASFRDAKRFWPNKI